MPENMIMQSILNLITKLKKNIFEPVDKTEQNTEIFFPHSSHPNSKPIGSLVQVYFSLGFSFCLIKDR